MRFPYGSAAGEDVAAAGGPGAAINVDLGTGSGRMLTLFGKKAKMSVGLDLSQNMLNIARTNVTKAGVEQVELRHGDIFATRLPDRFERESLDQPLERQPPFRHMVQHQRQQRLHAGHPGSQRGMPRTSMDKGAEAPAGARPAYSRRIISWAEPGHSPLNCVDAAMNPGAAARASRS